MLSWLHRCANRFYWVMSADGIYLHISASQQRLCSQPYIGCSCKILRCWHTPRQGKSSPENTHPHLEAEISIKRGHATQYIGLIHAERTFATQSVGRRSKSEPAVLTNVGTRSVDAHAPNACVTERTLIDIYQRHRMQTSFSHTAAPQAGMLPQPLSTILCRPSQLLSSDVTW